MERVGAGRQGGGVATAWRKQAAQAGQGGQQQADDTATQPTYCRYAEECSMATQLASKQAAAAGRTTHKVGAVQACHGDDRLRLPPRRKEGCHLLVLGLEALAGGAPGEMDAEGELAPCKHSSGRRRHRWQLGGDTTSRAAFAVIPAGPLPVCVKLHQHPSRVVQGLEGGNKRVCSATAENVAALWVRRRRRRRLRRRLETGTGG